MIRMLSEVDGGCPAFTHFFFDGIAGNRGADHLFSGHAREANRNRKSRIGYFLVMRTTSRVRLGLSFLGSAALACSSSTTSGGRDEPNPRVLASTGASAPDMSDLYRQIGLLAAPGPVAFVGKISAFASKSSDTTLLLVSISLPNRALTFTREGDRYRAPYEVNLALSRGDAELASVNAMEIVQVGSFRDINRSDESVIFQHYFRIPPGNYGLSATVRDVGGSRNATQQVSVSVPALGSGRLSTPTPGYEA